MGSRKQEFTLAGLTEAWLSSPRKYAFEVKYALEHLHDQEEPNNLFVASYGKGLNDGLLIVTDIRLLFVRFKWFGRGPFVRSIPFSDIATMSQDSIDGRPVVQIGLTSGDEVTLQSTKEHAQRFGDLIDPRFRQ